MSDGNVAQWF